MQLDELKKEVNEAMERCVDHLKKQMSKVRTGRATAAMLDGIVVNYYGTPTPLAQVGQISTPDARTLQIHPYERSLIPEIEKAVLAANLGTTPMNDGNFVRLPFAALTEEKRKLLVKDVKKIGEETKVNIRNVRRDCNEKVKKIEKAKTISEDDSKKYQAEVQVITDNYIVKVDKLMSEKEKDLMAV